MYRLFWLGTGIFDANLSTETLRVTFRDMKRTGRPRLIPTKQARVKLPLAPYLGALNAELECKATPEQLALLLKLAQEIGEKYGPNGRTEGS